MEDFINKTIKNAEKDPTAYLHLVFGSIHNFIITILIGALLIHGFKLDASITKTICLILCFPVLIYWEIRQKKKNGKNTLKQQITDILFGWISAPFIVFPYIELINN